MTGQQMRIITLLARHGTEKYPNALHDIRTIFAHQMPEVTHEIIVIDNNREVGDVDRLAEDVVVLGGDNVFWEFSAWDRGLLFLGSRMDECDFIHFATSAFRQLYAKYIDQFDVDMLSLVKRRAAVIGHIDYYNDTIVLLGHGTQSWVRSSFFFIPPQELRILGSLVGVTNPSMFFSGDPTAPFRRDAPLSESYRRNILGWLTGTGTGQGTEWHSRFILSKTTISFFEAKTLAILNEQMLTNRLRIQGCSLVDATWLASCAERPFPRGRPLVSIPDWRMQVRMRDTDAGPDTICP